VVPKVAVSAIVVALVGLVGVVIDRAADLAAGAPSPCELFEAREGGPWPMAVGDRVGSVRAMAGSRWRLYEQPVASDDEAGTVVRVSGCHVPEGYDLVVYVARAR
jgi:hypothetical protein